VIEQRRNQPTGTTVRSQRWGYGQVVARFGPRGYRIRLLNGSVVQTFLSDITPIRKQRAVY